ncbi:MAG: pyridoxal-phosphate dependent enzyme [Odoribacter sp.]|nr:pyridoxal-phosphate dependent enzyme [Odoribacter sp.]
MKFYSTRDKIKTYPYSLKETAFRGLAPDGGLFMPEYIPQVDMEIICQKAEQSFPELAFYLADLYFGEQFEKADLQKAVTSAFNFPVKLNSLDKEKHTLELFHGPTYAFKDFGARFMGHILQLLNNEKEELIILTATSGDTGSAVAHGFYNLNGIKVVILYPDGKVSDLQESQMTTLGKNIYALKIKGTFDDCQRMVKEVFNNTEFRKQKNVTSANSINLLRWLPQSFYYFYGYYLWCKKQGFPIRT